MCALVTGVQTCALPISSRPTGGRAMMRRWFAIPLWKRVLGGLVLGLLLALVWPEAAPKVAVFGDLFVRAIRMLVAPIVLVTIAAGITSLADPKRLGPLGGRSEEHTSELQSLMRHSY